ncbi:hypothetical protein NIES4101_78500 [Calothrix sp. NIES-4101]|nr:hypothetical protein NIES4101_78500 [Calothrix sp. NIES-4101]
MAIVKQCVNLQNGAIATDNNSWEGNKSDRNVTQKLNQKLN